jgi:hypothetical protein
MAMRSEKTLVKTLLGHSAGAGIEILNHSPRCLFSRRAGKELTGGAVIEPIL